LRSTRFFCYFEPSIVRKNICLIRPLEKNMVSRSALILDPKTNGSSSFFCSALDSTAESDVRVSGRKKPVRILIADDHEAVRRGLRTALSAAGWEVCADVVNGKEAVAKASELKPDLIILDISMPVMGGLDAARLIRTADPSAKIVIFTMHESQQMKEEIARIGVQAHAVKSEPMKNLLDTIKAVLATDEPRVN
jgi:CheY-like chemotaxis protein